MDLTRRYRFALAAIPLLILAAGCSERNLTALNWVGIMFTSQKIDASEMTHLHMDLFAPEGTNFRVKVVAFGSANDETSDHELRSSSTRAPRPPSSPESGPPWISRWKISSLQSPGSTSV